MADSEQDPSQKTEEPTQRRLEKAYERGDFPISREVSNSLLIAAATISIAILAPVATRSLFVTMRGFLEKIDQVPHATADAGRASAGLFIATFQALAMPFLFIMAAAILAYGLQTRFRTSTESLKPKLSRISLQEGFKRLFSSRSVMEFVKGILKIILIGSIVFWVISSDLRGVDQLVFFDFPQLMPALSGWMVKVLIAVASGMSVLAVLDYLYQRQDFMKRMRMTPQEIKDELKETEGDPQIRSRLRRIRTERARSRIAAAVPKATVVVTNPTHFAVALRYEPTEMDVPVVVAKGQDLLALRIRELASEYDIPIVENPPLAQILFRTLRVDQEIKPEHYDAVAGVIRYIMNLKQKRTQPMLP